MKGLILNIVAFALFVVFYPIGYFFSVFSRFQKAGRYNEDIAISVDMTGNVVMAPFFNVILIKSNGYVFGNRRETISSALGKNQKLGTLSGLGTVVVWVLDKIEKDHCLISINENV